ncbi:intercellular adhesion molecule 2-like isoform X1 [Elephas maximus indicus]|uniref:intercellular adhesion molecule 2-like isoform X1 n=2 Tax=Elephas maximus indicus TaxID=99487 RepID=UPI002115D636|nr:intercellular adhesion molecule 2-like isoform X1 [Elephas maximus indicus]
MLEIWGYSSQKPLLIYALGLSLDRHRLFPVRPQRPPEMSPFRYWGLPIVLLTLLCCPGSGEEAFVVYMSPEQVVAEPNGSLEVNCSTDCSQPQLGGLETSLTKTVLDDQPQWKRFLVSNISQDTGLECYFICSEKQLSKNATVSVYHPPKQVMLKLRPTRVAMGQSFIIECKVPTVAPLRSLTLTLLRGNEMLHNQTFEQATAAPEEAVAIRNVTAHWEDGHHNFLCRAELDLRSLGGGIISSVSEPQALEVYGEWEPRGLERATTPSPLGENPCPALCWLGRQKPASPHLTPELSLPLPVPRSSLPTPQLGPWLFQRPSNSRRARLVAWPLPSWVNSTKSPWVVQLRCSAVNQKVRSSSPSSGISEETPTSKNSATENPVERSSTVAHVGSS